ncbi:MAG: hypothetical protein PF570_04300, partial [Candidatus Cloacimonetes bacterium]|nr:hypothetical protein [Candidatus Cloacimonadota bacterium]
IAYFFKFFGSVLIIIATLGFGFHNWKFNNSINDIEDDVRKSIASRDLYVLAYTQFRERELKCLLNEVELNIGLLFAKIDLKTKGIVRPKTEEGIQTAEANLQKSKQDRIIELAYAVDETSEKEYYQNIKQRLEMETSKEELDAISNEIQNKMSSILEEVHDQRDNFLMQKDNLKKRRDLWYLIYLTIQVIGIFFIISVEIIEKKIEWGNNTTNNK